MENYRLEKRTSKKSLFGVVWLTFGTGLFVLLASVFLTYATGRSWITNLFIENRFITLLILISGLVGFFSIAFFGRRMKLPVLLIFYAITVPYLAISVNLALIAYLPDADLLPVLGVMLIPGGIIMLMGAIGYFELINIRKVQTLAAFLFVGFIIGFIVSFFWRSEAFSWWISVLAVLLLSVVTIIDFFMMRNELEQSEYGNSKEMLKIAVWYGVRMFFNYAIMLLHIIRIIGLSRR